MKNKHTPGPWFLDNQGEKLTIKNIREMPMKNGTIEEIVLDISQGFIPNSANAALIAAAPELYEMVDKINAAFYTRTSRKEWLELMEKTKPLLQKARGE